MSTQPIAPPAVDVELIAAVEDALVQRCEIRWNGQPAHDVPADFLIAWIGDACPQPSQMCCVGCWVLAGILMGNNVQCAMCNHVVGHSRDDVMRIVRRVRT